MSQFEPALEYVLEREGGVSESANDPGGVTNRGISYRLLKSFDNTELRPYGLCCPVTVADIHALNLNQVSEIYRGEFWNRARFSAINSQSLVNYLFDACVNMGIAPGVKCLQRACWAVARDRTVLVDDGILGQKTLERVNSTSSVLLLSAMRSERGGVYRMIAQNEPSQNIHLDGWLNRSYNKAS